MKDGLPGGPAVSWTGRYLPSERTEADKSYSDRHVDVMELGFLFELLL
jgi:hypothetical protein